MANSFPLNLSCSFSLKPISCFAIFERPFVRNYHGQTMGKQDVRYPIFSLSSHSTTRNRVISILVHALCKVHFGPLICKWYRMVISMSCCLLAERERETGCKCKTTRNPCIYFNYHLKRPFDLFRSQCIPNLLPNALDHESSECVPHKLCMCLKRIMFSYALVFFLSFPPHRLGLALFTNFNQMEEFIASHHAGTYRIDARALLFDLLTFHFFRSSIPSISFARCQL